MFKLIYMIIDGLGGLPINALGGKTALEAARTPNMDSLARNGKTGLMYSVGKGIAPESDVAVLSILGYDPFKYHVGRGPLEACGIGMLMEKGELAMRCNFATLGKNMKIIDRRVGRDLTSEESSELAKSINEEVKLDVHNASFEFKSTFGHRGVLLMRVKNRFLSDQITNTDPAYERIKNLGVAKLGTDMVLKYSRPLDNSEAAKLSADLLNEFTVKSREVLEKHEININRVSYGKLSANAILSRDAGNRLPSFFKINERYGVRFACFVDMPVERGIAELAGMDVIELPPPTADIRSDCLVRVDKIIKLFSSYDCFYIHLKGPDEPGHDGDYNLKTSIIEAIDQHFLGYLLANIELKDCIICITADHSTPCTLKSHSDDPVPVLVAGGNIKADKVEGFSEKECGNGSLKVLERGTYLMPILMKHLIS